MQAHYTTASDSPPAGGLALLDFVVLIAMAVTAIAIGAGLTIQAGLPLIASAIAGTAAFLVMAASYLAVARAPRGSDSDRLDQLEGALGIIDSDLQRIARVEDDLARLGEAVTDLPGGHSRFEALAGELENVHARIEGLRTDLQAETRSQRDKITKDLGLLEGLITQLSNELVGRVGATAAPAAAPAAMVQQPEARAEPEPDEPEEMSFASDRAGASLGDEDIEAIAAVADILDGGEGTILASETVITETVLTDPVETETTETAVTEAVVTETVLTETVLTVEETVEAGGEDFGAPADAGPADGAMLATLQQAIEAGRVDLYLQAIVTLPARKVRYYEGLTRIRTADDEIIVARDYLGEAARAGIMPLIDNVLLVKSVQVLRRRDPDSRIRGVFCNISAQSLLDPDYFPELVEFLEENSGLSESLIFELHQPEIMELTRAELGALDTLGALGFNFSLNHVVDLDIDYIGLNDRYFRFLKLDAATFLGGLDEKGAPLPPADMVRYLEGFGLQLIVDKVESEATVGRLVDAGVELAQGTTFAEPKPVTPALFRELEDNAA